MAGCSTGEEAYSLVIALIEFLEKESVRCRVQMFGTDINESVISRARSGLYPERIKDEVSAERLRKFFTKADGGYRINKAIRDQCMFARQNVIEDPPFSHVDLISCRNVLIYFDAALQKKVMPVFHYALKPNGYLVLGTAESIGIFADLFATADIKYRIYEKKFSHTRHTSVPARFTAIHAKSLMDQMREYQNLMELQNEQLNEAHAELEFSHHRYVDLYDRAPVGYLTLDGRGCIREINQTAAQLLGWSSAHLMGSPLLPHVAAADRKILLKHLWDSRHSPQQVTTALRLNTKDRGERYVQFASTPTAEFVNRPTWCRTAIFDITEQNQIKTALSASEAKFHMLAENIGDVFWFMELDPARVTYVSPAFEQIWGMPANDLYANHALWEKAIHPEDLPAVDASFHRWLKGETKTYRIEYRVINRHGEIRWLADRGIVIGFKDGSPNQISGIARDITERKLAEMALSEKASETNAILEGIHDGILIADVETQRFVYSNTAMRRMLGVTPEELLKMGMESIHPQDELPDLRLKFDAMSRGELAFAENVPLLRKDGSSLPVDITASPMAIKGRASNIGIFHDISERKLAEAKFRSLLKSAPDAMIIVNQRGLIELVNTQAVKLFGYTMEELIGYSMEMLVPDRVRGCHVGHRANYAESPHARPMGAGIELFARHKDGR